MFVSEYFSRQNRQQYGGEGYIASTLAAAISANFFFIYKVDKLFSEEFTRKFATVAAMAIAAFLIQIYIYCYSIKTPWYRTHFWPPADYTRGPLMRDQGNNI